MIVRALLSLAALAAGLAWIAADARAAQRTGGRATAKVAVRSSEATPYDPSADPALVEVRLEETFTGDLQGASPARALGVRRADGSSSLVSLQRFTGKLGGRTGGFVLRGEEQVAKGKVTATWSVVPGSGTGELAGLRGRGGFKGDFGKGSDATLVYWFE